MLVLDGNPRVVVRADEIDLHGLPGDYVSVTAQGPEPADVGLEDLECVASSDGDGLIALFPGVLRVGAERMWVPSGARICAHSPAQPGDRVASWPSAWTPCLALAQGVVDWNGATVVAHEDATGLQRHATTSWSEILVRYKGAVVQAVGVPPNTVLLRGDGEACVPGDMLALNTSDQRLLGAPAPHRPPTEIAAAVLAERPGDADGASLWLGALVKLHGDDPKGVGALLPPEVAEMLGEIGRRQASVRAVVILGGSQPPNEAEQRSRFRFLRGLKSLVSYAG